jgi:galactitol PTS system EIIC component
MNALNQAVMYLLSLKTYVMLPIIIFILCMVFRLKISTSLRSSFQVGFGFIGIFMVFDRFVALIQPAVQDIVARTGLTMNVLDVGWPPLAAITWSFKFAPLLVAVFFLLNMLLLVLRLTKTVDIDIWNFWHVILAAAMVEHATGNIFLSLAAAVLSFVMVLKLSDWCAPRINAFSGMDGICIPHLSGIVYYPIGVFGDWLIGLVPGLKKLDADSETIRKKLGLAGEPAALGFVLGLALALGAGYGFARSAELSIGFAAVVYILPKMAAILGGALIPVSEGMKEFIARRLPKLGKTYIGLDVAVLFGIPSVFVATLLLTPFAIILAFILPGVKFIPLGDLNNLLVPVAFIAAATRGNIVRTWIIGIPVIIGHLYAASALAEFLTAMGRASGAAGVPASGVFTSFVDGGQLFRFWLVQLCSGKLLGFLLIPVVAFLLFFTWRAFKKEPAVRSTKEMNESEAGE